MKSKVRLTSTLTIAIPLYIFYFIFIYVNKDGGECQILSGTMPLLTDSASLSYTFGKDASILVDINITSGH